MNKANLIGIVIFMALYLHSGEWRVMREILGEAATTTVVAVPFDDHVFGHSLSGWIDVRVLDRAGREVPRVIEAERDYSFEERNVSRGAKITSLEQLPEGGLAVVCEIDRTNALSLTQLTIRTPLRNYEQTVTVYVPDRKTVWRQVRPPEPLFDYSRFADVKKETVDLPGVTNRVFKLVIARADDDVFSAYTSLTEEIDGVRKTQRAVKRYSVENRPFRIDAVAFRDTENIAVADKHRMERIPVKRTTVAENTANKITTLTFPSGRSPAVGLTLNPDQKNFERMITVECPVPGGWRVIGDGVLARSHLPGVQPSEHCEMGFTELRADTLRVKIRNDDNPPLTFGKEGVTLVRQLYSALFIAEKGEHYRLVYGNPDIKTAPVYEQSVTAYLRSGQKAAVWPLAHAANGTVAYGLRVSVRRMLTQHGMMLFSLLVMVALGVLILRAVRHAEKR